MALGGVKGVPSLQQTLAGAERLWCGARYLDGGLQWSKSRYQGLHTRLFAVN